MNTAFKPVITLVGRANVGKSTLFNRITRSRAALVANQPGLTRDRHYGEGRMGRQPFIAVDTGGFEPVAKQGIVVEMAKQTTQAIAESDVIIFLVDARAGLNAHDHDIAQLLRRSGRPVLLAVNKAEGMRHGAAISEFHELGLGEPWPISASHGAGVAALIDEALEAAVDEPQPLPAAGSTASTDAPSQSDQPAEFDHRIRLAIAGRPNVGKSTLINTLLGQDRLVAYDQPGTTRDAIEVEFDHGQARYTLIDTAGLRRRGRVFETIEKFSVIKTLQAIEASNVVVLMLDAQTEISDQDAHIAGFILETGRALVVAINKWDGADDYQRERIMRDYHRKLRFLSFAQVHTISAVNNQGISAVLRSVRRAHAAAFASLSTPRLTRCLRASVEEQPPPRKGNYRPKMRYAHQGGQNPPRVIVHGTGLDAVSDSYRRYLESSFRKQFKLEGTPLRIEFRSTHNPYVRSP